MPLTSKPGSPELYTVSVGVITSDGSGDVVWVVIKRSELHARPAKRRHSD